MIIEGTFDDGSGPMSFRFLSDDNEERRIALASPLEVVAGAAANVTLSIDPVSWFVDSAGGMLDPRNPTNEEAISDNIERSIRGFRDSDRDGRSD